MVLTHNTPSAASQQQGEITQDAFSQEEQDAWLRSQNKLQEASKIGHTSQLKFAQANQHLNAAEAASRDADEAAARHAEHQRELQHHQQGLDGLKAKLPGLHDAHTAAGRDVEQKLAAQQQHQQQLGHAERAAAEKENAVRGLQSDLDGHQARHQGLEEKLAQHRRLTKEREEAHRARQGEHDHLRKTHDTNLADVDRLVRDHEPLRKELEEHEARLQHLRKRHDDGQRAIYAAKDKANHSHQRLHSYDPSLHHQASEALENHRHREKELAAELAAAKEQAHAHQHHHHSALAEHKKALDHFNSLKGRAPDDRELLEAQRVQEGHKARLAELEAQAKASHGKYRHHRQGVEEHGGRAAELQALADRHAKAYQSIRSEGDDAAAQKERLWKEAKHEGDSGLGHFHEKVTGMDSRLDQLGDKIKGALTGNKAGATHTHTQEGVAGGALQGHHHQHGHTGVTGGSTGGLGGGVTHPQGAAQGVASNGGVATRDGTSAINGQGATHGGLGSGVASREGTAAGRTSVLGGQGEHTHDNVGVTSTGHGSTNPATHTEHASTTSTSTGEEGGLKSKIKGLFSSKN